MADPVSPVAEGAAALDPDLLVGELPALDPTLADLPGDDARFEEVARLVAKGDYQVAGARAAVHIGAGLRDWRLAGPYLFAVFLDGGMAALPTMFESLRRALDDNRDKLGPTTRQAAALDNALRWLLRALTRHLEFHERAKDDTWQRWCEPASRPGIEEALGISEALEEAIARAVPDSRSGCVAAFERVVAWLRELGVVAQTQVVAPPPAPDEGEGQEDDDRRVRTTQPSIPSSVPMSPALRELLERLAAFDGLVGSGEFTKAGVVAADLLRTVERFDPVRYLPSLFAGFFAGLSRHMERIEPTLQSQESLAFRALDQLYRSDLDSFIMQAEPGGGGGGGDDDDDPAPARSGGMRRARRAPSFGDDE